MLEQAEPMAKDITRGIITPGAQEIAKNAVPITEEVSAPETSQSSPRPPAVLGEAVTSLEELAAQQ